MSVAAIEAVVQNVFPTLDDDSMKDYFVSVLQDTPLDEYVDSVGPFLLSLGLVSDDDEMEAKVLQVQEQMRPIMKGTSHLNADDFDTVKKLENTRTIEHELEASSNNALCAQMWGFDKIRKQVNDTLEPSLISQSARQIRKAVKDEKIMTEREEREAAADAEWENTRVLPDLSGPDTGDRDIHVPNVNINFKGLSLLSFTDLKLVDGRRYGFIGNNGTGKTTLLRFIAKYEIEGFPKHVRIQHVEQESAEKLSSVQKSVLQVVMEADYERQALVDRAAVLEACEDEASAIELSELYNKMALMGTDTSESKARLILKGLQFTTDMIENPAADLSGGWRMRAALAGALFMTPDLLLLDEPTNHLDLEAVMWLETYLQSYENTLVIVSHDRNFLDAVITDVIHLHNQKLNYYKGDYGTFEKTRKETLRTLRKAYDAQQAKIAHMQEFIDKFRFNAKKAPLVQSRIKALNKLELVEEPEDEQAFRMNFPPPEPLGRPIISVTDVAFKYGTNKSGIDTSESAAPIFTDVNFSIDMESRIGVLGRNGSGKSTLINLILGKLRPTDGHVSLNPRLRIASFTQHHVDQLNLAKSAIENMSLLYPKIEPQEFRNHLGRFNVSGNMATKPTRKLSGGQKSRVAFAILTWNLPHVIILDEPTNHLDIETIDALIEALQNFKGGILIVSHDQHFVNSICTELWCVDAGAVSRFRGSMADYKKKILP